jgi:hypothetical protein
MKSKGLKEEQSMEKLKRAIKNRETPFNVDNSKGAGGKVISLRVSQKLEDLLQELSKKWDLSMSETVRSILNFYFLPPLLEEAWEQKVEALLEEDLKAFGEKREDLSASTLAQRIEPVLVDDEEAGEYATFLFDLMDKNQKHYETLRDEAVLMGNIASERYLRSVQAMENMKGKLPTRKEGNNHEKEVLE